MIRKLNVSDLMSGNVVTIDHDDTLDVAEELMRAGHIHHLPVVQEGRLIGMLAHSDILKAQVSIFADLSAAEDRALKGRIMVREVMSKSVKTATPETSASQAARTLASHDYSSLPIISDDKVVGIITERDFLDLVVRALESEESAAVVAPANGAVQARA